MYLKINVVSPYDEHVIKMIEYEEREGRDLAKELIYSQIVELSLLFITNVILFISGYYFPNH